MYSMQNPSSHIHATVFLIKLTLTYCISSGNYNDYLEINGGIVGTATCNRAVKPTDVHNIDENTQLIKLISLEDTNENDWLYIVLMDIVSILVIC